MSASPCPDAELLLRYVEGGLATARRERVEAHVDACPTCASLVAHAAREVSRPSVASAIEGSVGESSHATLGEAAPARAVPERIGRYLVLGHLGAGGMGTVWSAIDPRLQRVVAIKRIATPRGLAGDDGRLLLEARSLARLAHPNVVAVFEVGREPGAADRPGDVYLVMELVQGPTLRAHATLHEREPDRIVDAYLQAARGLAAAHAHGIVHRDFKPDNAIVGVDGRVRVVDFGLARPMPSASSVTGEATLSSGVHAIASASSDAASTREIAGTPSYMAPEQRAGERVDARSDQFSFCVSLWEALTGRRPGPDPRPDDRAGEIPPAIRRALRRGLARDPVRRFPSMHALVAALRPRRRRTNAAIGAAVLGGLGLCVGLALPASGDAPAVACDPAAEIVGDAWTPELAAAVERRWSAHGTGELTPAADLSRWADRWLARRARVCEELDPAAAKASAACLRESAASFRALVDLVRDADDRDYALWDAIRRLPDPAACDGDGQPTSDDPRADEILAAIARAQALRWAARADGARAITQRAVDDAIALGDEAVLASALLEHATALAASGEHREAATTYEAAFHRAEGIGLDAIAADAAAQQVLVVGVMLADVPAGEAWARHARAAIDRLAPDERTPIEATLATSLGNMWMDAGRWDEARAQMETALELIERAHGPDHPLMVLALGDLGAVTRESDPPAALAYFERSLEAGLRAFGEEHPDVALALGNIGAVHENRGDPQTALRYFERARRIAEAVYEPGAAKLGLAIFNTGVAEEDLGDRDAALASFTRALAIWSPRGREPNPFGGLAHVHLGNLAMHAGELDDAESHFRAALASIAPAWGEDYPQCEVARERLAEIERARAG